MRILLISFVINNKNKDWSIQSNARKSSQINKLKRLKLILRKINYGIFRKWKHFRNRL